MRRYKHVNLSKLIFTFNTILRKKIQVAKNDWNLTDYSHICWSGRWHTYLVVLKQPSNKWWPTFSFLALQSRGRPPSPVWSPCCQEMVGLCLLSEDRKRTHSQHRVLERDKTRDFCPRHLISSSCYFPERRAPWLAINQPTQRLGGGQLGDWREGVGRGAEWGF